MMEPSDWNDTHNIKPGLVHYIENDNPVWAAPYVLVATNYDDSGARVAFYDPEDEKWFSHNYSEVFGVTHWMFIVLPTKE